MRKKGPTKTKNKGKGAHKDQNKGPLKFLAPQIILMVPKAYESLNPGLIIHK
jgi:hypothetical protein